MGDGPTLSRHPPKLSITSLVLAIVALVFCWSIVGGVILGVGAVVTGVVARRRVRRGEPAKGGIALADIVLGIGSVSWPRFGALR